MLTDFLQKTKIKIFSRHIGGDEFGNEYYEKNGKRFVVYKGICEPSKVPAEWFPWLHHTTDKTPVNTRIKKYHWQKLHVPNLTGTRNFYSPVAQVNSRYKPWSPIDSKTEKSK